MAPPHNPISGEPIPLHRGVRPIPVEHIRDLLDGRTVPWPEALQIEAPRYTFRDDLIDFWLAIKADIHLALVMAGLGFAAGLLCTVGLAYLIAAVAL